MGKTGAALKEALAGFGVFARRAGGNWCCARRDPAKPAGHAAAGGGRLRAEPPPKKRCRRCSRNRLADDAEPAPTNQSRSAISNGW